MSKSPIEADDVQCLVCGLWGRFLGTHIARVHGMTGREYREANDLPASTPLASASFCEMQRQSMIAAIQRGDITHDHLPDAVNAARSADRGFISSAIRRKRSAVAMVVKPSAVLMLPPGSKRADGRDADRAREAQRRRRAKNGNRK